MQMGILTQMNENWRWPPSLIAVGPDGADAVRAEDAVQAEDAVVNWGALEDQAEDADPPENLAGLVPK
jgi:hypothetical protein